MVRCLECDGENIEIEWARFGTSHEEELIEVCLDCGYIYRKEEELC